MTVRGEGGAAPGDRGRGAAPPVQRLESLVERVESGGWKALRDDELLDLGRAYRRSAAMLARARTAGLTGGDTEHLNRLVARAYPLVYAAPPHRGASVLDLLAHEFPRAVRREWIAVAASVGVFLVGIVVGALALELRPDAADFLLGAGWSQALDEVAQRHVGNQDWLPETLRPAASTQIMTNNIRVATSAFALGLLLCLGSLYLMGYNGVMMGAVAVVVHWHHVDLNFWSFVAPHGVLELPAILISGAAGMIIGYAVIDPGRLPRTEALKRAARRAVPLVLGVVLTLVLAGLIEGFFSPDPDIPPGTKMSFAALLFLCLVSWLAMGGAKRREGAESVTG